MRLGISVDRATGPVNFIVDTDEAATVETLASQLAHSLSCADRRLFSHERELPPQTALQDAGLLNGMLLGLGSPPGQAPIPVPRGWQLHVVAGPQAGTVLALPLGKHTIGRGAAVEFADDLMSWEHARLVVDAQGASVIDLGSTNGTFVDGARCEPEVVMPVKLGAVLRMGETLLVIREARGSDAATEPAEPGWLTFLRPPRLRDPHRKAGILMPEAPPVQVKRRFPIATLVAPLILGVVMATLLGQPMYLLFSLASPLMMVGNMVGDKRSGSKDHKQAVATYLGDLGAAQRRLDEALGTEQTRRRAEYPDAADTLLTCILPGHRLWERRRPDDDAMTLRVGTTELPADVTVDRGRKGSQHDEVPHMAYAVPVTLALRTAGIVGLAGPDEARDGVLRWWLVQLCAYHAPRDLSVTLVTTKSKEHWNWSQWLPHLRSREIDSYIAAIGNDNDTAAARIAEVLALVKARQDVSKQVGRVEADYFPAHVVVVDGARELRATPGLSQILQDGPSVGVYALCADTEARLLPETCQATVVIDPDRTSRLNVNRTGAAPLEDVLIERVTADWALTVARALTPLKDVSTEAGDVALPDSARLLDTLSLEPPTVDAIRARWLLEGRTTRMTLGAGLDGPFSLDLRADGPHGLIAGTTGSGKSELLQTIIASLAVANRPDAMNFVLVDYKGGSAFKDCVYLPHTVGMVTDLDNHLVERALTSLGAELKYREHFLADAAVKDIDDYLDLQNKDPSRPPLPRLLIVIDEFASMARELPDFVTGLVNIAQRGRSLGIHLILATQRPSGVVSPEIRANTNLRISLRVTDAADSTDVLESAEAARISKTTPGRGYARLGAGTLVPFQAGRVGGRRPGAVAVHVPPPFVAPVTWQHVGYLAPTASAQRVQDDVEVTDLSVLVRLIKEAAGLDGVAQQRSPWLEALPSMVLVDDLVAPEDAIPLGITDVPAQQQRRVATFDFARDGHLIVLGAPRSGRSQLLRTLAAGVGRNQSIRDTHLFGIDCGAGALLPLQELPHCGAVVSRNEPERAARLITRIANEMGRRQQLLAEGGYADISEQRRGSDTPLPRLLVLVDRWEGFTSTLGELDSGKLTEAIMAMLREGASLGVHLVITGDRSLGSGRISSLCENKMSLRLADRGDYSLVGLNPRSLAEHVPDGRAFAANSGLETQIALLAEDNSAKAQAAVLSRIARDAAAREPHLPDEARPFRVDVLPNRITLDAALELARGPLPTPFALAGVGGDDLQPLGPDLRGGATFIVAGPGRCGRSTVLIGLAESVLRTGGKLIVVSGKSSSPLLAAMQGRDRVLAVVGDPTTPVQVYMDALAQAGESPVVLVLDDAESLRDCPASEFFRDVVRGVSRTGTSLVLGGNAEGICTGLSGWQVEAKKSRSGLLLSPQGMSDGDLIGVRLPRSAIGGAVTPGRGILHLGDSNILNVATVLT